MVCQVPHEAGRSHADRKYNPEHACSRVFPYEGSFEHKASTMSPHHGTPCNHMGEHCLLKEFFGAPSVVVMRGNNSNCSLSRECYLSSMWLQSGPLSALTVFTLCLRCARVVPYKKTLGETRARVCARDLLAICLPLACRVQYRGEGDKEAASVPLHRRSQYMAYMPS